MCRMCRSRMEMKVLPISTSTIMAPCAASSAGERPGSSSMATVASAAANTSRAYAMLAANCRAVMPKMPNISTSDRITGVTPRACPRST